MYNLGTCYKNGRGVEQNYKKAVELYEKAVALGNSTGIFTFDIVFLKYLIFLF